MTLKLTDFVIPPDDVPEDVRKAVKHWSQWIDYWAVDWDNKGDTFHNEWQTYRTRKDTTLALETHAHLRRARRLHGRRQGDRHPRQRHDEDGEGESEVSDAAQNASRSPAISSACSKRESRPRRACPASARR